MKDKTINLRVLNHARQDEYILANSNLPRKLMVLRIPLSVDDKFRSHCATGITKPTPIVSYITAKRNRPQSNNVWICILPKPTMSRASSNVVSSTSSFLTLVRNLGSMSPTKALFVCGGILKRSFFESPAQQNSLLTINYTLKSLKKIHLKFYICSYQNTLFWHLTQPHRTQNRVYHSYRLESD